jgi:hypothetical protein
MKKTVLVLFALLSLVSFAQSMAQTATAPDTVAQFLATLSDGQVQTPNDQAPAPSFLTGCTDTSQCPTGQLCCFVCGNPPADDETSCRACVTPVKGRCPIVV